MCSWKSTKEFLVYFYAQKPFTLASDGDGKVLVPCTEGVTLLWVLCFSNFSHLNSDLIKQTASHSGLS